MIQSHHVLLLSMLQQVSCKVPLCVQGEQADTAAFSGDTDDEGSGWETASDAEEDDDKAAPDAAQPAAAMDAEGGAGVAPCLPCFRHPLMCLALQR